MQTETLLPYLHLILSISFIPSWSPSWVPPAFHLSLPPWWGRMGDSLSACFHDTVKRACEWGVRGSRAVRGTQGWLTLAFMHSRGRSEPSSPFLLLVISFGLPSLFLSLCLSFTYCLFLLRSCTSDNCFSILTAQNVCDFEWERSI